MKIKDEQNWRQGSMHLSLTFLGLHSFNWLNRIFSWWNNSFLRRSRSFQNRNELIDLSVLNFWLRLGIRPLSHFSLWCIAFYRRHLPLFGLDAFSPLNNILLHRFDNRHGSEFLLFGLVEGIKLCSTLIYWIGNHITTKFEYGTATVLADKSLCARNQTIFLKDGELWKGNSLPAQLINIYVALVNVADRLLPFLFELYVKLLILVFQNTAR